MLKKTKNYLLENFFPIKKEELKKILFICLLKGIISSVYALLTNLKDVVIIGAEGSGAEALPVIRGFFVLPFSILLVVVYSYLSNKYKPTKIFYIIMSFFSISFILYSFVLRPNEIFFSPNKSAEKLLNILGSNNYHWVAVYKNWIHSFFYILSELWLQATIFILFWEFVNRVCSINQAKRSYNLFIASGGIFNFTTSILFYNFLKYFKGSFNLKFKFVAIYINFCILLLIIIYYFLNKNRDIQKLSKQKTKLSFLESIKHIFSSKYLICLLIMTVSLGLGSNLISITWKANLKNLYPIKSDFINFMIKVNSLEHLISAIFLIFISGNIIRKRGWKISASITPLVILITGSLFFISSKFRTSLYPFSSFLGISTLKLIVILGAIQVLSTKISRYAFYDMTKEIAYIPLDNESRTKGKAAIDTIGSRFGKSASSYIHLFILWIAHTGSVLNITIFLIPILILICTGWLYSVKYISSKLKSHNYNV
ncbi:MAG: hypothetical protein GY830_11035 [Bacteroidetes bacterium]|nr:hypothetical protein [Bacteroidota bacterium]